jgi:hypothetical protein
VQKLCAPGKSPIVRTIQYFVGATKRKAQSLLSEPACVCLQTDHAHAFRSDADAKIRTRQVAAHATGA